jgi:Ser/Thr protein kinase RdoA (MazF antagonist)
VKTLAVSLLSLFLLVAAAFAQEGKRIPPGIRQADKAEEQFEKSIPPAQVTVQRDPRHLQQDANELARLAESIPTDVEQAGRGILHNDLNERLKKIEKLSKRLRNGLTP